VTEDDVLNGKSGTVLTCPAHDGATPHPDDHVAEVLREAKAKTPDGSFSAWVCRFRQLPTLALAAGLADRIYVDPFIDLSDRGPEPGESVWPQTNHAILNYLRAVRRAAGSTPLVACVDVGGEPKLFNGKGKAIFDEVEWLVLSAVGAGFQGIAWRGNSQESPFRDRLQILQRNLLARAEDLGSGEPVPWASATESPVQVSALRTPAGIVVVLLNPDLMVPGDAGACALPREGRAHSGIVSVSLPAELQPRQAVRLDGAGVAVSPIPGGVRMPFRFAGGGTALFLELTPAGAVPAAGGTAARARGPDRGDTDPVDGGPHAGTPRRPAPLQVRLCAAVASLTEGESAAVLAGLLTGPAAPAADTSRPALAPVPDPISLYRESVQQGANSPEAPSGPRTPGEADGMAAASAVWEAVGPRLAMLQASGRSDLGQAVGYCLLIPLLSCSDAEWSDSYLAGLPEWLVAGGCRAAAEWFALRVGRPLVGMRLVGRPGMGTRAEAKSQVLSYLAAAAQRLRDANEFSAVQACHDAAVSLDPGGIEGASLAAIRFCLAEYLSDRGRHADAFDLMDSLLAANPPQEVGDKGLLLRLRYANGAGRDAWVATESRNLRSQRRWPEAEVELLRMEWDAKCRLKQEEDLDWLAREFLDRFASDPRAPDVLILQAGRLSARNQDDRARPYLESLAAAQGDAGERARRWLKILDRRKELAEERARTHWTKARKDRPNPTTGGGQIPAPVAAP
jgi:hypothetical protein